MVKTEVNNHDHDHEYGYGIQNCTRDGYGYDMCYKKWLWL